MKSVLPTLAACALVAAAADAPIAGDWMGSLDAGGKTLRIALHLKHEAARWSGTFDSPDQAAFGIAMDQVDVDGNKLVWKMAASGIVYEGAFDPANGAISGTFSQGGGKFPPAVQTRGPARAAATPAGTQTTLPLCFRGGQLL
jgi:hypothetical protein